MQVTPTVLTPANSALVNNIVSTPMTSTARDNGMLATQFVVGKLGYQFWQALSMKPELRIPEDASSLTRGKRTRPWKLNYVRQNLQMSQNNNIAVKTELSDPATLPHFLIISDVREGFLKKWKEIMTLPK